MSARIVNPRLAAFAVTGAAALSLAALTVPAPAHAEGDRVVGPITSVSGDTFQINRPDGPTTVQLSNSTVVSQGVPAQFSDVTVGSCIKAGPSPQSAPADSGNITAQWVFISTPTDGTCSHPPATPPPVPAPHRIIGGTVDAVSGDTITVTRQDPATGTTSQATVTVSDSTGFRKRVAANRQAITAGECAAARGATDGAGVLQATKVTVWPATNGECPRPTG